MNFLKKMSSGRLSGSSSVKEVKVSNEVAPKPNYKAGLTHRDSTGMKEAIGELRQEHDAMQLKTFTRWWNSWLHPRGTEVNDLCNQSAWISGSSHSLPFCLAWLLIMRSSDRDRAPQLRMASSASS